MDVDISQYVAIFSLLEFFSADRRYRGIKSISVEYEASLYCNVHHEHNMCTYTLGSWNLVLQAKPESALQACYNVGSWSE